MQASMRKSEHIMCTFGLLGPSQNQVPKQSVGMYRHVNTTMHRLVTLLHIAATSLLLISAWQREVGNEHVRGQGGLVHLAEQFKGRDLSAEVMHVNVRGCLALNLQGRECARIARIMII